jgi:hypothetical protein
VDNSPQSVEKPHIYGLNGVDALQVGNSRPRPVSLRADQTAKVSAEANGKQGALLSSHSHCTGAVCCASLRGARAPQEAEVVTQDEEEKDAPEHLDPRQVHEKALAEDQNIPPVGVLPIVRR